jgi:heat shock protein HtpX
MVAALQRLGGVAVEPLPQNLATAGITDKPSMMSLFASHPPIEERIAALQQGRQ